MKDPIILWPRVTPSEIWDDCKKWVEDKGGLGPDNPGQMMAAAGADPGIVSCPSCRETHWAYGIIHRCPSCSFVYPTDWWKMFAWGSAAGRREAQGEQEGRHSELDEKRKGHPYWDYGYRHRCAEPWVAKDSIDWRTEIGDCYVSGGEFRPVVDHSEQCRGSVGGGHKTES